MGSDLFFFLFDREVLPLFFVPSNLDTHEIFICVKNFIDQSQDHLHNAVWKSNVKIIIISNKAGIVTK